MAAVDEYLRHKINVVAAAWQRLYSAALLCYAVCMKISDDDDAKLKLWAREGRVCPMPKAVGLPRFGVKRFRSYDEMNAWKREYLDEMAAKVGVRWKKS